MKLKHIFKGSALAGGLVFATAICAQGYQGITVDLNGQPVNLTNGSARMMGDRVMVPLRGVLENIGANVQWDQASQTITVTNGSTNVTMRIGDRTANVNGQNVALDQSATIVDGTTMVPLRFLSQAFGAQVNWDAQSRTVDINTANALNNTQTVTTTANLSNQNAMPPLKLADDVNGWISKGQTVHFTMTGAPGGQASVVVPGVAADIPMQETSPGQYQGTWTPSTDEPVTVLAATAMGKLALNGNTYYSTAVNNLNIDTAPPVIEGVFPRPNSVISGFQPDIRVNYIDQSGVDPSRVSVQLNGQDITSDAKVTDHMAICTLPNNLAPGQYNVGFSVTDKAGNVSTRNWTFAVIGNNVSSNFTHTGIGTVTPGEQINFSLQAAPGSTAEVVLGNGETVPLSETSTGVFTGNYIVKPYDHFGGDLVTANITAPDGKVYTIQAAQRMGVSANIPARLMMPVITSPLASQNITDPLVISGSAPPASTVLIHISYRSDWGPHATVTGELADIAIPVDTAGNYQTKPIHLMSLQPGMHVVYHLTARTVLPDGTQSDPTELTIHPQIR